MAELSSVSKTPNRISTALHLAILVATLTLAMAWPRSGQAALLIPLGQSSPVAALDWLKAHNSAILGPASGGYGMVIRLAQDGTPFAALTRGWLLIAVPEVFCTSKPPTSIRT